MWIKSLKYRYVIHKSKNVLFTRRSDIYFILILCFLDRLSRTQTSKIRRILSIFFGCVILFYFMNIYFCVKIEPQNISIINTVHVNSFCLYFQIIDITRIYGIHTLSPFRKNTENTFFYHYNFCKKIQKKSCNSQFFET
eukprot:UN02893